MGAELILIGIVALTWYLLPKESCFKLVLFWISLAVLMGGIVPKCSEIRKERKLAREERKLAIERTTPEYWEKVIVTLQAEIKNNKNRIKHYAIKVEKKEKMLPLDIAQKLNAFDSGDSLTMMLMDVSMEEKDDSGDLTMMLMDVNMELEKRALARENNLFISDMSREDFQKALIEQGRWEMEKSIRMLQFYVEQLAQNEKKLLQAQGIRKKMEE